MTSGAPWRRLLPVYLSCLGYGVQAGAAMPLVPLALQHRGIDNVTIGLVEAVWGIGMIATAHRIPAVAACLGAVRLVCASCCWPARWPWPSPTRRTSCCGSRSAS